MAGRDFLRILKINANYFVAMDFLTVEPFNYEVSYDISRDRRQESGQEHR